MTDRIRRTFGHLGISGLVLHMNRGERDRLLWASLVPFVAIVNVMAQSATTTAFDFESRDEWVTRIYFFTSAVEGALVVAAVASLFLLGIGSISRAQASWALLLASTFFVAAISGGIFSGLPYLVKDDNDPSFFTGWYSMEIRNTAYVLGSLAIGYAFLAYRGLSAQDYGRRVYGQRRRRFTPPTDAE